MVAKCLMKDEFSTKVSYLEQNFSIPKKMKMQIGTFEEICCLRNKAFERLRLASVKYASTPSSNKQCE